MTRDAPHGKSLSLLLPALGGWALRRSQEVLIVEESVWAVRVDAPAALRVLDERQVEALVGLVGRADEVAAAVVVAALRRRREGGGVRA